MSPQAPPPRRGPLAALGRALLLAAGLALGGWLLRELGGAPGGAQAEAWVRRFNLDQTLWGEFAFLAVGTVAAAVGVPRQAVAFLGGYALGPWAGLALSMLAQVLSCAAAYGWARLVGRGWAQRRLAGRFGRRLRPLHDALAASPFGATLALRLLPVGNNLALNLLAGLSGLPALPFLAASAVGYLPQTAIFVLAGAGVAVERSSQMLLAAVLFLGSALIGVWLLRRHRAGRAMQGGEG
ncbi:TVP38/TMEM64 family protein [Pseudoroseomonas rhizosphaerae]|uniref:TVP38/TMEM64 family membrane protein n=1 Tax=Teichococcus rhizosphaerae TaxID=1335062 RepID=A0A2C7AA72_9PROT|nr:VTT domain-containing protein [Pseudoroseomonas rhizosphaerae]PHK94295.1 TVP38/TMEM64 family protein [Pseudoroseomonas rhizosphaerae]